MRDRMGAIGQPSQEGGFCDACGAPEVSRVQEAHHPPPAARPRAARRVSQPPWRRVNLQLAETGFLCLITGTVFPDDSLSWVVLRPVGC